MIYRLLRKLIKIALFFFFKEIVVSGKKNMLHQGPLIIVANHPNTLMDPLIIASIMKQQIGFLGNAGLFSNPFLGHLLKYFNVIPVFRKKDIANGEKPNNKYSFSKCHDYLNKKGTILIFPEGSSYYELKLREIKTGTARIALSYESLQGLNSNLKILPIALDYSDAIQFRSMVSVTIDEPISVQNYKKRYLENEIDGVLKLTETIRKKLDKHIPNTTNKEQEQFLLKIHKFYTTFNEPTTDLHLNPKQSLDSRTQISKTFYFLQENNPELYSNTEAKVYRFFDQLNNEKSTPGFFTESFHQKNRTIVLSVYFLKFLLLSPIYLFGLLVNYIPYILPFATFKALKLELEYKTSVQMIVGLIAFPLFYWLEIKVFGSNFNINFWGSWLLVITFLVSGYITMYYWTEVKRFKRVLHFYFLLKPEKKSSILKLRDEILNSIEFAKSNLQ
jgi:glycerol-3-phosphate O-acyltransferase/dihydroxyacetone phosphate acyltransferase